MDSRISCKSTFSRRIFINRTLSIIYSLLGFGFLSVACSRSNSSKIEKDQAVVDPCTDLSDLSDTELETRQQLGYASQSSFADRTCLNCKLFVKSDESITCGSCLVIKGPVEDLGYCTVWAPLDV